MDSNLLVELYVTKRSCQDLFKELSNIWIKKSELDNHDFFSLEGLQLAGLSACVLSPDFGHLLNKKNHGYPVQNLFIQ